jgi:uncharacterized membrane protein YgaE (UPF0421/DUF939 family)
MERTRSFLIYAAKCVTGTLVVFLLSLLIHYNDPGWCLISVILVLSPDGKDTVSLVFTRIKANLVGAGVGLLCLLLFSFNMWSLSLGLVISLSLCYLFKLDAGARSAMAATIIIMLHQEGKNVWSTAIERVIAVVTGCVLGLIITFAFHYNSRINAPVKSKTGEEA